ncbi:MAG: histone deacetylase [Bacillota bacterium]|jgi:acetoin utilization deacetylase AcuC-like enzyme
MDNAGKRVGLIFFPAFDWAISPDHPEREERLLYTRDQIVEEGLLDLPGIKEYKPEVATALDVQRAQICIPALPAVCTQSHLVAAGGTITAGDLVMRREVDRAFALLRPPGHHAFRLAHGARGFCALNNEAIMIEHLRHVYGSHLKIAVVDTDAHHADGSQDIYYNDPDVLHISVHQDGRTLFPGSGAVTECGGPGAYGLTLNAPLPPGSGDRELLYVLEQLVLPVLADFQPDLVINAAGQDNHYTDPLTNMNVTAEGYARLTELLRPDIVVLEGGYSIEGALPYVNVGIILALAGCDYTMVREPEARPAVKFGAVPEVVRHTVGALQETWRRRREVDLKRIFGSGPYFERSRRIYYDTDVIVEEQQERIRRCDACSGYRIVFSVADKRRHSGRCIGAVLLPWHVCNRCRAEAEDAWEQLGRQAELEYVYLQDVAADRYLVKKGGGK